MIRVSHELPKALFPQHDLINDYPYVLAHLLMKETGHYDYHYAQFYKNILLNSTFSIMDNSCFELGQSIDPSRLIELANEYQPSHLVLPDIMGNMVGTIAAVENFLVNAQARGLKLIGVIQGRTESEYFQMLEYYNSLDCIDLIAINFREIEPETTRFEFISKAIAAGRVSKPLHLLGAQNPLEFKCYSDEQKRFIHSIDTSCPIVYGWNGLLLDEEEGSATMAKPKTKLADNLNIELSTTQIKNIIHNVRVCRSLIHNRRKHAYNF